MSNRNSILPNFFSLFLVTVSSYLPSVPSLRRQLLGFLYLTRCMVKDMSHSKRIMHEKVLSRVMSRIIRLFGDDELLFILKNLNRSSAHNLSALTAALCGENPPPLRIAMSPKFLEFLQNSSKYAYRFFIVLSHFPKRCRPNYDCHPTTVMAYEFLTLFKENELFRKLFDCPSKKSSKRIFYAASRNQTKSFQLLMKSLKHMRKACGGESYIYSRMNCYEKMHFILNDFWHEMCNMKPWEWERLYDDSAKNAVVPTPRECRIKSKGGFASARLTPMNLCAFPMLQSNYGKLLIDCKLAFSFPQVSLSLLDIIYVEARQMVSISEASKSTCAQGMYFVLAMIRFHQSGDPLLSYIVKTIYKMNADDPQYKEAYEFDVEIVRFLKNVDDHHRPACLQKVWKRLNPGLRKSPLFLSCYPNMNFSTMFQIFWEIIKEHDFFCQIEHFISENSSANQKSIESFLRTMKATSLDTYFQRKFHQHLLPPLLDPAFGL